jgi:ribosome-associated protein
MTTTPVKNTNALEKKDVQKLQRAIIDGLEDVKAVDIQVFDTEHITSLFERVIVASGTSNRQTKALAASVRDAVRDAGFAKPRIEGEANGEWIIVDCGAVVAHIMQPTIRQYYHLEELWGEKPVKTKLGAPAPLVKASKPEAENVPAPKTKPGSRTSGKTAVKAVVKSGARTAAKKVPAKTPVTHVQDSSYVGRVGKTNDWTAKRNASEPAAEPKAKSPRVVKTPIVKVPATKKAVAAKKAVAKPAAKKPVARKTAPKAK